MLAWLGACDVDAVARADAPALRRPQTDARPVPPEPGVCEDEDWYGCPGNPCAHGWCFVGKCVGQEVGRDGRLLDPGVCCVDGECLEIDP